MSCTHNPSLTIDPDWHNSSKQSLTSTCQHFSFAQTTSAAQIAYLKQINGTKNLSPLFAYFNLDNRAWRLYTERRLDGRAPDSSLDNVAVSLARDVTI